MALKQRHWTAEMAKNDTKMVWNCDRDREKGRYNSLEYWSSKRETTGFEIQTRDIRNPLKKASP